MRENQKNSFCEVQDLTQDAHQTLSDLMGEHESQENIEARENVELLADGRYLFDSSKQNFAVIGTNICWAFFQFIFGMFGRLICSIWGMCEIGCNKYTNFCARCEIAFEKELFLARFPIYNRMMDKLVYQIYTRWIMFGFFLAAYIYRAHFLFDNYEFITLNLFSHYMAIGYCFVHPVDETVYELPTRDDEFRIFERLLPELKAWKLMMFITTASVFFTFFELYQFHLFCPIMVLFYYALSFIWYCQDRIRSMIKYGYVPYTVKPTYTSELTPATEIEGFETQQI